MAENIEPPPVTETDPRWDGAFRRKLRHDLRTALEATQRDKDDITVPDELIKRLTEEDKHYKKVVSSREAVIDSEHFKLLSEIGRHQSQIARGELVHFDHRVYAQKLSHVARPNLHTSSKVWCTEHRLFILLETELTFMGGQLEGDSNTLEWNKLGEKFLTAFNAAPCGQFIYGALETVPVVQKVRNTRKASDQSSKVIERPKEVSLKDEEETTTKDVSSIMNALKRVCKSQGKVHYFKFLVDPNCFAHTVENIFHFAFLVKEGRAGVQIEDGQPYIYIYERQHDSTQGASVGTSSNQGIISIDMNTWKQIIDKHQITEAAIKRK